jgi:hypothetical protein
MDAMDGNRALRGEERTMARGDAFWRAQEHKDNLRRAEADGVVADSMNVRQELIRRMDAGELTLEQVQAELAKIKRNAKKNGKVTRNQAWKGRY